MSESVPFDVDNCESLSLHDIVQAICEIVDELSVQDFLSSLLILGTRLNWDPHTQCYSRQTVVAMMMQCEASLTWTDFNVTSPNGHRSFQTSRVLRHDTSTIYQCHSTILFRVIHPLVEYTC